MTEADWLKSKDPDAMLGAVSSRLSERKWRYLAAATVRRAWELLPDSPFRDAVVWLEDHADRDDLAEAMKEWRDRLDAALPLAIEAARQAQREAVHSADPDATDAEYHENDDRRTHPAVPLFRAASRSAGNAIQSAGLAVQEAGTAVRSLFTGQGPARLALVRRHTIQSLIHHGQSGIEATLALELKARGDDMADRGATKKVRLRQSEAIETVNKLTESAQNRIADLEDQKQAGDKKALGRFLHEQLGNPYRDYRFEPAWRTDATVGLARAIFDDRAMDRFPILADALLDADCDEEAILRHCRGTEKHTTEPPQHFRGCWVLDLILQYDLAVYSGGKLSEQRPAREEQLGLAVLPPDLTALLEGLDLDEFEDLDDDEEPAA